MVGVFLSPRESPPLRADAARSGSGPGFRSRDPLWSARVLAIIGRVAAIHRETQLSPERAVESKPDPRGPTWEWTSAAKSPKFRALRNPAD